MNKAPTKKRTHEHFLKNKKCELIGRSKKHQDYSVKIKYK